MIRIRPFGVLFRIFVMCLTGSHGAGSLSVRPDSFLAAKRQKTHTETDVAQLTSVSWQEVTYNFVDLLNKK